MPTRHIVRGKQTRWAEDSLLLTTEVPGQANVIEYRLARWSPSFDCLVTVGASHLPFRGTEKSAITLHSAGQPQLGQTLEVCR